ncbi:hypothetical protein [Methylosinus sp. LW4]|uniref:hypothetical protein n=1 Tax=Methylosinus sp. LW4 TaxID=136993 RepID=UPI00035CE16D|nr:hypothetical protein [Methylosinus sp. LW4]
MSATLIQQIEEIQLIIIGGEDWLERAQSKNFKRSPEAIERRAQRLVVQEAILDTLTRLREAEGPRKAARP